MGEDQIQEARVKLHKEMEVIEKAAIDRMLEKVPIDELIGDHLGTEELTRYEELMEALECLES